MRRLGGTDTVSTWRLSVGAVLVSGGVITAALGLAKATTTLLATVGIAPATASWLGVAAAGVLVPLALLAGGRVIGTPTPYGRWLAIGAGIAVAGVPLVVVTGPTTGTGAVLLLAALPYAAGVVIALWCLVASAAAPRPRTIPAIRTGTASTDPRASAADGGEDDDLRFPLEDDR
ncbi:MAG: hypothetical protein ABEJ57_06780 [Halobacteriaceae archaeon]